MSIARILSDMFDSQGLTPNDVANMLNIGVPIVWNARSRGISKMADLISYASICGYKVYLYNEELNMKVELTKEDFSD